MPIKPKAGEEKYFALASFPYFVDRYFGMKLPVHQIAWSQICEKPGNKVIFAPAAHGKTSVFSVMRTLWKIAKDRTKRRIIASSTEQLSSDILSTISYQLMNNQHLIADFGPFHSSECEWSEYAARVLQADYTKLPQFWKPSGKKDPTIRAVGVGSSCLGFRCDELITDDILTIRNSRTEDLRKSIRYWWWNELEPTVDSGGTVIWVGNPVHRDDLSQELKKDAEYKTYVYKAILDDRMQRVLWREKWPYEKLARRRERDPISFARRYQSVPVSESDYIDWDKLSRCFDGSKTLRDSMTIQARDEYKSVAISVDPAFTLHRKSSYSVILTIGLTQDNKLELIGGWKSKVLFNDLKHILAAKISSFRPHVVLIESNAQQSALISEVERFSSKPKVVPCFTGGNESAMDDRFSSLVRLIDAGSVILPYADDKSKVLIDDLCNEIAEYPSGEHNDLYMAFSQASQYLVYLPESKSPVQQKIWQPPLRYKILGRQFSSKIHRPLQGSFSSLRREERRLPDTPTTIQ